VKLEYLTVKEKHRLRIFEEKLHGKYLDQKQKKLQEDGEEDYIMKIFVVCSVVSRSNLG
jgi:hypothetical protein